MRQKNWKKVALMTAPLLVAGSVYAFAADGGASQAAAGAASRQGAVTYNISQGQPLTQAELQELAAVKPAQQEADTAVDLAVLDEHNPFVVQEPTQPTQEQQRAATAEEGRHSDAFDLSLVKKLELQTQTTLGELKLEFT
ncbi:MAG TPA: hypothetical protein VFV52_10310, partial [Bacilli bacterium]|nr:hypothetical protein [Bacilli bacterium]